MLIPSLLPEGTWIQTLDILYNDSANFGSSSAARRRITRVGSLSDSGTVPSLVITLDGYAYSANKGEQFKLVNTLLGNLKNSEEFSGFFQNIVLETIRAQKLQEEDVTYFKIQCKQTNENIRPK